MLNTSVSSRNCTPRARASASRAFTAVPRIPRSDGRTIRRTTRAFESSGSLNPWFVRTFTPAVPRVAATAPSYLQHRISWLFAASRWKKLYSFFTTSDRTRTSTATGRSRCSASTTRSPRDFALVEVRPRRFDRAATRPYPLTPIHVPPAVASRGAAIRGLSEIALHGRAGRSRRSSRFMPTTRGNPRTTWCSAINVHIAAHVGGGWRRSNARTSATRAIC